MKYRRVCTTKYWGYLAVFAILHAILTSYTPLILDDWYLCFVFGTDRYIEGFNDFIQSRYNHYLVQNGRIFPETLANLWGGIGKGYFNVINGVMFAVFIHLIIRNFGSGIKYRLQDAVVISFIIVLLYPGFSDCFLWMSGSCNYLWSAVAALLYWDRFKVKNQSNVVQYIGLFVLGIMCGASNEAVAFPFVVGIGIYAGIHWRDLQSIHYCMLIGLLAGILSLILCPALWKRVAIQESSQSLGSVVISTIRLSYRFQTILLVFLVLFVTCVWKYKRLCVVFVKKNGILLLILCVSFLLILYSRSLYERTNFCTNLLAMILLFRLLSFLMHRQCPKYLVVLLAGCTIIVPVSAIPSCIKNFQEYEDIEHVITTNNSEIIPTCEVHPMGVLSRFVGRCIPSDNNGMVKTYDASFYVNKYIATYYHKSSVIFVPSIILVDIQKGLITDEFNYNKEYPYYVKRHTGDVSQVIYKLRPVKEGEIPFIFRPLSQYMGKYTLMEVEASNYGLVKIEGVPYLFVDRNETIDDRVERIEVK